MGKHSIKLCSCWSCFTKNRQWGKEMNIFSVVLYLNWSILAILLIVISFCADILERWGWLRWKARNMSIHAYRGFVCVGGYKGHGQQFFTEVISRTPSFCHELYICMYIHYLNIKTHGFFLLLMWLLCGWVNKSYKFCNLILVQGNLHG